MTKPSFRILTKIQLHNLYKTSAEKSWPNFRCKSCLNFNFKILIKLCAQSLNKSLALWPNLSFQFCNKLLLTQSSSSTSATITTSTSFENASSNARVTSIKFTKQEGVSESVSDKGRQWSDSGPIKMNNKWNRKTMQFQIVEEVPIVQCVNVRSESPLRSVSRDIGRKNRRKSSERQRLRGTRRGNGETGAQSDGYD